MEILKKLVNCFLRETVIVSLFFSLMPQPVTAKNQGIKNRLDNHRYHTEWNSLELGLEQECIK